MPRKPGEFQRQMTAAVVQQGIPVLVDPEETRQCWLDGLSLWSKAQLKSDSLVFARFPLNSGLFF